MKYKLHMIIKKDVVVAITVLFLLNLPVIAKQMSISESIGAVLGQNSLSTIRDKILFIVFEMILQYAYSGTIVYFIKNYDYLLIRYKTKKDLFFSFLRRLSADSLSCSAAIGASIIITFLIGGNLKGAGNIFIYLNLICMCVFISLFQAVLILNCQAEATVLIMIIAGVAYAFISQIIGGYIPVSGNTTADLVRFIIGILSNIFMYLILSKKFMKEWQYYAN